MKDVDQKKKQRLKIHERFVSIQGEGARAGFPHSFIRLSGCDLRCHWCDTRESWSGGEWISHAALIQSLEPFPSHLLITGGEPLLQRESLLLFLNRLHCQRPDLQISMETGGHHSLEGLPDFLHINMDVKLSGSREGGRTLPGNFSYLKPDDEVKFVVVDPGDFQEAVEWIREFELSSRFQVFLSPVFGRVEPEELVFWTLQERLNVRIQMQLHKIIWGPDRRGV